MQTHHVDAAGRTLFGNVKDAISIGEYLDFASMRYRDRFEHRNICLLRQLQPPECVDFPTLDGSSGVGGVAQRGGEHEHCGHAGKQLLALIAAIRPALEKRVLILFDV
jgi:hypothetical protein